MAKNSIPIEVGSYTYYLYYHEGKQSYIAELRCGFPITPKDFKLGKNHRKQIQNKKKKIVKEQMRAYIEDLGRTEDDVFLNYAFEHYMVNYKVKKTVETTYDAIWSAFNIHIKEILGDKLIKNISSTDVQEIIDNASFNGLSLSSLKRIKACLNCFFNYMINTDYLNYNPISKVTLPSKKELKFKSKEKIPFDQDETNRIMDVLFSKNKKGASFYKHSQIFVLAFETGMRIGEICALKWKHIYIDERIQYINIYDNLVYANRRNSKGESIGGKLITHNTKTINGSRQVPLTPKALEALELLKSEQKYYNINSEYVVAKQDGAAIKPATLSKSFKRICTKAQVQYRGVHIIRHTMATKYALSKMNRSTLATILGHSNELVTQTYYIHVGIEDAFLAINAIANNS